MTLFIRDDRNTSLAEVNLWIDGDFLELSSFVYIKPYSMFLRREPMLSREIIQSFSMISELRGWLFEGNIGFRAEDFRKVLDLLRAKIDAACNGLGLCRVED